MKSPNTILLVEDDPDVLRSVGSYLKMAGFAVLIATNGEKALDLIRTAKPDVVVLDERLPTMQGHEVLEHLRLDENWTPVIFLSVKGDDSRVRTRMIDLGAEDYMAKPFDVLELIARIRKIFRQAPMTPARTLVCGALRLDLVSRGVWLDEKKVPLSPRATDLLALLMSNPGVAFTSEEFLRIIWGWNDVQSSGTAAVRTRIRELRQRLQDDAAQPRYIAHTSYGYSFVGQVEAIQ